MDLNSVVTPKNGQNHSILDVQKLLVQSPHSTDNET